MANAAAAAAMKNDATTQPFVVDRKMKWTPFAVRALRGTRRERTKRLYARCT